MIMPNATAKIGRGSKRGNILLLALLIMSSIMLAASGLTSLIINSLQQTKAVDNGILAFYGAETGIEEALYLSRCADTSADKRCTGAAPGDVTGAGRMLTNNVTWTRTVTASESSVYIPTIPQDGTAELLLYDPDTNTPLNGLDHVEISWTGPASSSVPVLSALAAGWFKNVAVTTPDQVQTYVNKWTTSPATITLNDPNKLYRLRLRAENTALSGITVKAWTGLPTPAIINLGTRLTVTSNGDYYGARQRLSATWPRRLPAAGLFDFVMFSECSLVKTVPPSCP